MSNQRELFRMETHFRPIRAVELTSTNRSVWLDLIVLNLSGGGMLCQVSRPVAQGAIIQVTFGLGENRTLTLKARIIRQLGGPVRGHPTYRLGCRFVDMTQAEQDALVGFVFSREGAARRARWEAAEAQRGRI